MKYAALLIGILFCAASAVQGRDLFAIKGPIDMDYGASPRFAVVFNHSSHKKVACKTCHHIKTEAGKRFVACTVEGCHSEPGARLRDPLSMFMAYHAKDTDRSCYGCHKMKAERHPEFRGCRPCHMSPLTREALAKQGKAEK